MAYSSTDIAHRTSPEPSSTASWSRQRSGKKDPLDPTGLYRHTCNTWRGSRGVDGRRRRRVARVAIRYRAARPAAAAAARVMSRRTSQHVPDHQVVAGEGDWRTGDRRHAESKNGSDDYKNIVFEKCVMIQDRMRERDVTLHARVNEISKR
ncbi:unnamed protein product [Notodromas monacha]|uniref:Uncharacterized protein n=1 Tax=Notodromas monacha TaxID=399045 RepID=A0A7R9GDY9_9CRUS|nr:unnamed protein product [Notodromas monacha]CAG0919208.1 unnamed protein product [Notodromas monacha]